jgi:hypothetical protein
MRALSRILLAATLGAALFSSDGARSDGPRPLPEPFPTPPAKLKPIPGPCPPPISDIELPERSPLPRPDPFGSRPATPRQSLSDQKL